ncbi:MAG: hypothetical protein QW327_05580, partial [Candidatus Odinarchaeota archaeon]
MLWTVTVILWWFWLIFTNLIPGWSILLIFYRDLKNKFNILEIFAYSFCFGTAYLTILGFILDWTIGINLINIIIPTCAIILAALIFRRKYVIKQLRFQFTAERYKGLILIFLVLAFGLVIRVGVPLANEILMAWDPWHWLNISKNIVYQGHSLIGFKPLYPSGYAYITGISCLFDLELTYLFIQLISVGLYFIIGCITVICLSNKILKNNKIYSLFGGLIFSSSYFLASYGMLGLPQNVAFALIPAGLFFASQSGLTRIQGFFLIVGVYIIHSPSAMLIIITLFIYGLYYIVTNREAIHYKETKIIIIFLSLLALTTIGVVVVFLPFVVEYFIKFTYASSIKPEPIHYL